MKRSWTWTATLVLLALSLAVNFFLVGYAMHGLRQGAAARVLLSEIAGSYPPEVRKEFRGVLRDNRARTFQALRELRAARANLAAAQSAKPFDEAAVKDAMAAVRSATTNLQATMQDYLLAALKNVNAKAAVGG
ncbi:periplasmic heavy metal sensor [Mesorhizobium sp. B2-4-2]|uniref:periplasmic heavy metal sensor n=1 Tax=unclassified Mesorhizobium TaxID=325217 RepID=UPI0011299385|nr:MULTISPECIES: periplasmic heavy metal sensor [unclassified Mesorhizobium]MBZ9920435.1 periplasmic heavy metal sensor [Mesorhizobium sp. BR1-1-7]MBZ9956476.1 periplasmic heavy metal sensor [Mesorhizobium sp. BR1-1-15]MBZ9961891.1 periplasmic heavy metal sensor [Mesorhizobium sp. BR1-1-14]MBZ9973694.1 periplasmic heavy metal sensor [Mesorhizobium sp. BR1-1-12]TPL42349.1 periplasmic heavy metal sensor [Mesorhizobium sp. B2-4-4]